MTDTVNVNLKSLEAIETSGIALETARKFAEDVGQEKRAAAALIPGAVDGLISGHMVQEHERPLAATKLGTHEGALQVLGNLLDHVGQLKVAHERKIALLNQGQPANSENGEKIAGSPHHQNPNYVGSRPGLGEKKASDIAFLTALNLPV